VGGGFCLGVCGGCFIFLPLGWGGAPAGRALWGWVVLSSLGVWAVVVVFGVSWGTVFGPFLLLPYFPEAGACGF